LSNKNVMSELSHFGDKMTKIVILTLINIVLGIFTLFIPLVGFISLIISIVIFFTFLSALGNIKEAGHGLNNRNILEFRSKIILAMILAIIGSLLLTIGLVALAITIYLTYVEFIVATIPYIVIIIIGAIILVIAAILTIQAWGRLETFFANNMSMFPQDVSIDAKKGAKYCKIGAIFNLTVILSIVGTILYMIGYYKLSTLSRLTGNAPAHE